MQSSNLAAVLLRVGLAVMFLYAAISSFTTPNDWIGFLPSMITDRFEATTVLKLFSVIEVGVAVWLLTGIYVQYAALVCAAMLFGIVVSNFSLFAISFRDIGLLFAALALAALPSED